MEKLGRTRIISDRKSGEPYMIRYYVFLRDRTRFFMNIFLHKFLRSDPDDLHDHPWNYVSIPLWPGYWEHTLEGCSWRGPLNIRYNRATTLHRIELGKSGYCWSLFIPFSSKRDWGFQTSEGWVSNIEYGKVPQSDPTEDNDPKDDPKGNSPKQFQEVVQEVVQEMGELVDDIIDEVEDIVH